MRARALRPPSAAAAFDRADACESFREEARVLAAARAAVATGRFVL